MRVAPWAAVACLALATAGCGTTSTATVAASSPTPAVPTPSSQPGAGLTPASSLPQGLNFIGTLSGSAGPQAATPPCGPASGGLYAQVGFPLGGTNYQLVIEVAGYNGPGTYPAPPARVSVHKATLDNSPQLLTGTSGQVVVDQGGASGSVDEELRGSQGTAHVAGHWSC